MPHFQLRAFWIQRIAKSRIAHLLFFIAIILAIFSAVSPYFLVLNNFLYMFKYAGILGLLGFAETLIILAGGGGIDLSVGSMLSLIGVLHYFLSTQINVWLAAVLMLPVGMFLGLINGLFAIKIGIPPFISTLATMFAFEGLSLGITKGVALSGFPQSFAVLGEGLVWGIPVQFIILVAIFLPLAFILNQTAFGRHIYAVGDNEQAASLLGISAKKIRFILYIVNGILCAISAILMNSWLLTARPDAGVGYELRGIAVAVLGGTYIFGGSGTLTGSLLATIAIVMLQMGLQQMNINSVWQLGLIGLLLIVVAVINQIAQSAGIKSLFRFAKGGFND